MGTEMGYGTRQRKNQQEQYILPRRGRGIPEVKLSKVSLTPRQSSDLVREVLATLRRHQRFFFLEEWGRALLS